MARPAANRSLDLVSVIEDDRLHLRLDVAVAGAAGMSTQATTAWVAGTVVGPDGTARGVELTQTAAGLYEANLPAMEDGAYLVTLAVDDGRSRQMVFGGAAQPPGRELRDFASRRGPLEQVARITGGRVLEPASLTSDLLFDRTGIEPIRSLRPLLPLLLPWLIALLLVDVANRRVAWSATEAAAWASGRWRALTRHLSPRRADAAAATLGHLRRRAAEVDARMERLQQTQSQASEATQRPSVVGSKAASGPQDGRQTQPPEGVEPDKPAAGGLGEGRSRLLEAKRRARRRFDENR